MSRQQIEQTNWLEQMLGRSLLEWFVLALMRKT